MAHLGSLPWKMAIKHFNVSYSFSEALNKDKLLNIKSSLWRRKEWMGISNVTTHLSCLDC